MHTHLTDVEAGPQPRQSAYGHWNDPVCAAAYHRAWAHWRAIRRDGRMTPAEVDHRLGVLAELCQETGRSGFGPRS